MEASSRRALPMIRASRQGMFQQRSNFGVGPSWGISLFTCNRWIIPKAVRRRSNFHFRYDFEKGSGQRRRCRFYSANASSNPVGLGVVRAQNCEPFQFPLIRARLKSSFADGSCRRIGTTTALTAMKFRMPWSLHTKKCTNSIHRITTNSIALKRLSCFFIWIIGLNFPIGYRT